MKRHKKLKPIDTPLYRYRQALYLSFYSKRLYIDVAKRWKGLGLTYCLLLLAVATAPFSFFSMFKLNQHITADLLLPMSKIPAIQIFNGQTVFHKKMPYLIKNDAGEAIVIIDTTGKVTHMSKEYPKLVLLVTKDAYFFRPPKVFYLSEHTKERLPFETDNITQYGMKTTDNGVFELGAWFKETDLVHMKNVLIAAMYPTVIFTFLGFLLPILVVFSTMGQLSSSLLFKYKLKFKPACRLMMVASSVGVFVFFGLKMFNICSNQSKFFCLVLVFIYFNYGIFALKRESRQLVHV